VKLNYRLDKESPSLSVTRSGSDFEIELDGKRTSVQVIKLAPPRITFLYRGKVVTARVASSESKHWIHVDGATFVLDRRDESTRRSQSTSTREGAGSGVVVAPMPGQVRGVLVQAGDSVTEGQPLFLLEAMKMELRVSAPLAGTVISLGVKQGDSVERDQVLGQVKAIDTKEIT